MTIRRDPGAELAGSVMAADISTPNSTLGTLEGQLDVNSDGAATYHVPGGKGVFKGIDVALSALNFFNAKPQQIAIAGIYETPYDSLNYSPVGRFVSLTIGKSW